MRGNDEGWGSALIVSLLAAAAILLVAFVVIESRVASPMFDLTLFRMPAFAGASIGAFALSASIFAMFLYLTLYVQNVLGYSPFEAGLIFLPITCSRSSRRRSPAGSPPSSRRACSSARASSARYPDAGHGALDLERGKSTSDAFAARRYRARRPIFQLTRSRDSPPRCDSEPATPSSAFW